MGKYPDHEFWVRNNFKIIFKSLMCKYIKLRRKCKLKPSSYVYPQNINLNYVLIKG